MISYLACFHCLAKSRQFGCSLSVYSVRDLYQWLHLFRGFYFLHLFDSNDRVGLAPFINLIVTLYFSPLIGWLLIRFGQLKTRRLDANQ
jgi:hypothetical protein